MDFDNFSNHSSNNDLREVRSMKVEDILFLVFSIIAMILMIWYILAESPTLEQVLIALAVSNLGFSFKIYGDLRELKGKFEEHFRKHKK